MRFLEKKYDLDYSELVSIIDDLPLWSAPFGMKLLELIDYSQNQKILDIGSGMGFPLIEIANRLGQTCKIYGLDPWELGLERIQKKIDLIGLTNIELFNGIVESMQFDNEFFDQVISNNGINNVESIEQSLTEIHRTLKPEGKFIFNMNTDRTFIELYTIIENILMEDNNLKDLENMKNHIYHKRRPIEEMIKLIENSGLELEKRIHDIFYMRYSNADTLFNSFFFNIGFLDGIKEIFQNTDLEKMFEKIINRLNSGLSKENCIKLSVPFVTFICTK